MCWRIPITSLQGIPLSLSKKSFVPLNMTVFRLVLFYDKKEHKYKRDEKTNKLEFSDEMTIRKQTYNDIMIIIIELMQGSKVNSTDQAIVPRRRKAGTPPPRGELYR